MAPTLDLDALDFAKGSGLVTVVAQDVDTGDVLMVAHADREALQLTLDTRLMHYRSRTRGLWKKGETSGHLQHVVSLHADCDGDAVLARVRPAGPACHTGALTCFTDPGVAPPPPDTLAALDATIAQRAKGITIHERERREVSRSGSDHPRRTTAAVDDTAPKPSYTQRLLQDRNLRLKKVGEETAELLVAIADIQRQKAASEAADLLYHTLVALRAIGVSLDDVRRELASRATDATDATGATNATGATGATDATN